jgi:hypothetical protein
MRIQYITTVLVKHKGVSGSVVKDSALHGKTVHNDSTCEAQGRFRLSSELPFWDPDAGFRV